MARPRLPLLRTLVGAVAVLWWSGLLVEVVEASTKPLQLLKPDHNRTRLTLVESTLEEIEKLDGPVAVITITGPYHTGKSFLMNHLAAFNESQGGPTTTQEVFGVGRGVDPETSGVWMYHRQVDGMDLLFLDTEGFSVSNVSESYDAQVFAASTLFSSLLIYNSMNLLHAVELEYLDLLVHNTQLFSIKTSFMAEERSRGQDGYNHNLTLAATTGHPASSPFADLIALPPLLVSVQAFTVNLQGEECKSWLGRLLHAPVRTTREEQHMALGQLFPSVHCHTLFLPATSRDDLYNLPAVRWDRLTAEFRHDLESMRASLLGNLRPKQAPGGDMTGPAYASLIRLVVQALNDGALSEIPGRWEMYETHLRASSVRAALQRFQSLVKKSVVQAGKPLTRAQVTTSFASAEQESQKLLSRLLLGLDRSLAQARKEADKELKDVKKRLTAENTASVKVYIKDRREAVLSEARPALEDFEAKLPLGTKALEEWVRGREETLELKLKQLVGEYRDDPHYSAEVKELVEKAKADSNAVRLRNQQAFDGFFDRLRAKALETYRQDLASRMMDADMHLPGRIEEFHKSSLPMGLGVIMKGAETFRGEKVYDLHEAKSKVEMGEALAEVKQANSVKLRGYCLQYKTELAATISTEIGRLREVLDEQDLEAGLARAGTRADVYKERAGVYGRTEECLEVEKELKEAVEKYQDKARQELAEKIKRVLMEPLSEVCKTIIELKCPQYKSVQKFHNDVHAVCGHHVRKHDVGKKLSKRMLARVIDQFIDSDLGACRTVVMVEERRRNWWVKFGVGLTLMVCGGMFVTNYFPGMGDGRQRAPVYNNNMNQQRLDRERWERDPPLRRRDGW